MDIGLGMTMDGIAFIQAKMMESLSNIAGDMTKQITTLSEYDTSDVKGLLDGVDPVPVRNFVEEAKPKIGEFIDEMQRMAKKYLEIGIEKAEEAKKEIESEVCILSLPLADILGLCTLSLLVRLCGSSSPPVLSH